jgi:hypothetical protein
MKKYKDYSPTEFDCKGLNLPDKQEWLVVPVMQTRDSGPLELSNFRTALKMLCDESENVEVHRFGHWGLKLSLSIPKWRILSKSQRKLNHLWKTTQY